MFQGVIWSIKLLQKCMKKSVRFRAGNKFKFLGTFLPIFLLDKQLDPSQKNHPPILETFNFQQRSYTLSRVCPNIPLSVWEVLVIVKRAHSFNYKVHTSALYTDTHTHTICRDQYTQTHWTVTLQLHLVIFTEYVIRLHIFIFLQFMKN